MTEIGVSAVGRLKHTELWESAKKAGSQAALARLIGVSPADLSAWINLKRVPRHTDDLESRLFQITGKLFEELFPTELKVTLSNRKGEGFAFDAARRVPLEALSHTTVNQLLTHDEESGAELRELVQQSPRAGRSTCRMTSN